MYQTNYGGLSKWGQWLLNTGVGWYQDQKPGNRCVIFMITSHKIVSKYKDELYNSLIVWSGEN